MKINPLKNSCFFSIFISLGIIFSFSSCGYRFADTNSEKSPVSISVPYIQGDPTSALNDQLVSTLAETGYFTCPQSGGQFFLQVLILSDANDRIGFRYDRDSSSGARKPNILSIENRRNVTAQVTVYNTLSGDVVLGPLPISASVDYDYADYGSPRDLNTITSYGSMPTVRYSYGQLNTIEAAHDDSGTFLYKILSRKIVGFLMNRLQDF